MAIAASLINRMPTLIMKHKSPYEIIYQQSPDYQFLKIFECSCYPNLRPYASTELTSRSERYMFLHFIEVTNDSCSLHVEFLSLGTWSSMKRYFLSKTLMIQLFLPHTISSSRSVERISI